MSRDRAEGLRQDLAHCGYEVRTFDLGEDRGYYVEAWLTGDLMMGSDDYHEVYDALIRGNPGYD